MVEPIVVHDAARAEAAGTSVARILRGGRAGLLVSPEESATGGSADVLAGLRAAALTALARVRPAALVLVGGETAHHVLDGLGHPPLRIEARLASLVVRSRLMSGAYAGLAVVTKGGSTGAPDLLGQIARQLGRGAR